VCVGVNAVIAAVTSYGRICVPAHGVTQRHITPVMHDVSYQSITAPDDTERRLGARYLRRRLPLGVTPLMVSSPG
jgi:hypothetical protein